MRDSALRLNAGTPRALRLRKWIVATAVVAVAVAAAVGVATGAIGSDDSAPAPPVLPKPAVPVAHAPSRQALEVFAILRRVSTGTDALPATAAAKLSAGMPGQLAGINPALARRAQTEAGTVWVIPGNESTCLLANAAAVAPGATNLASASASCIKDEEAVAGKLAISMSVNASEPHTEFVAGLVPDGVTAATAQVSDGTTQQLIVRENVYTAEFVGKSTHTITFSGPAGTTTVHP